MSREQSGAVGTLPEPVDVDAVAEATGDDPDGATPGDQPLGEDRQLADGAARRRAPRLGGRRRRRVIVFTGVGLLAGAWWVGWHSPVTLVEHVVVSAPKGLSEPEVRLASAISAQDHVLAVDADEVRVAIMSEIPAVADVRVTRTLPDTIRLEVVGRTAVGAIPAGSAFYLLDAQGVAFDRVKKAPRVPLIRARGDVSRGSALAVLATLPADVRARVRSISANTTDDVTLGLRGGATVRWGSAAEPDLKARVLAGLLPLKATTYDVSVPLLPTTTGGPEKDLA